MSIDAKPLYFPSADQTLFGWLHQPRGSASSNIGVVICSPFGYETICAHRSLRAFADTCAAAGMPALRFDYSGTGDSSDTAAPGDQIQDWCADIRAAMDYLERACAVQRICLLGVRLGALLAGLVASQRAVDYVIAVAPVTSGRRYLRELRALAGASTAGSASNGAPSVVTSDGELEVTGFLLSDASIGSLGRVDPSKLIDGPTVAALILDRQDLPGAKPWATGLESRGVEVQYEVLPGFTDMVSTPHASIVPIAMIDVLAGWLERHRGETSHAKRIPVPTVLPRADCMEISDETGVAIRERAMFIDDERALFAIVTEPASRAIQSETADHGVILLNTGATSHIGPNRMYVELARGWAVRGYVVLRLDLAGLGDSSTRAGEQPNQVYPPGALHDIGVAIEFLRTRQGIRTITLAGLCGGAYHALRSAISGLPVNTILMINPLTFYWKQGSTFSDLQISEVVRNPGVYATNALSSRHWAKLLRGQVNVWRVGLIFLRRASLAVESAGRDLCRKLRIRLPNDLGWDLQTVTARGIRVVFLFARGDGGEELLRVQGGSVVKRLGNLCRIHRIDGADHIFTQRRARTRLVQLLGAELPPI